MNNKGNQTLVFAVCLDNNGYTASLEVGKLYRVISDEETAGHGYIRVVDESGEDYAFTANRFPLSAFASDRCSGFVNDFTGIDTGAFRNPTIFRPEASACLARASLGPSRRILSVFLPIIISEPQALQALGHHSTIPLFQHSQLGLI